MHLSNNAHWLESAMTYNRNVSYPGVEFMKVHNCELYCGEFGVIALADMSTRMNWHKDYSELLEEYGIGGAVWSYKEMDFEVYDQDTRPINEELIKILVRK